jgi:hypothetical protein
MYSVSEEGGDGEAACSETPSLMSYTLRYVSFTEIDIIFRVALREPMHLFTSVSEEGDDGEDVSSETPSLLSYTLRCVSFTEVGSIGRVALREPIQMCTCVSQEGGDGETPCSETPSLLSNALRYVSFAELGFFYTASIIYGRDVVRMGSKFNGSWPFLFLFKVDDMYVAGIKTQLVGRHKGARIEFLFKYGTLYP